MDKPESKGNEEEYKYKYFKYMYKLRKLRAQMILKDDDTLYSDTSSDSDLEETLREQFSEQCS